MDEIKRGLFDIRMAEWAIVFLLSLMVGMVGYWGNLIYSATETNHKDINDVKAIIVMEHPECFERLFISRGAIQ